MPKVSEEHKERRREEILEAAQRVFARHGYEGATVARLEAETGLSRGAIFSYFPSKDALFVAVIGRSSGRLVELWLERGFRALLDEIANEDPAWLAVQFTAMQRSRTDERFRKGLTELEREAASRRRERYERLRGTVRTDLPIEAITRFLSALANGLALARVSGDELGDLDTLFELAATGVAPRGET
jgi:TetR/AcrR family transcriptional regulator, transcriptional repressor of aconitase